MLRYWDTFTGALRGAKDQTTAAVSELPVRAAETLHDSYHHFIQTVRSIPEISAIFLKPLPNIFLMDNVDIFNKCRDVGIQDEYVFIKCLEQYLGPNRDLTYDGRPYRLSEGIWKGGEGNPANYILNYNGYDEINIEIVTKFINFLYGQGQNGFTFIYTHWTNPHFDNSTELTNTAMDSLARNYYPREVGRGGRRERERGRKSKKHRKKTRRKK